LITQLNFRRKIIIENQQSIGYLIKYNSQIFRRIQSHLDKILEKYELSSGTYPYLLNLYENEGITQSKLSSNIGHDKAMSARTISKLIDLGLMEKKEDENDSRAYRVYLTQKGKEIAPDIKNEIHTLSYSITAGLTDEEQEITMNSLIKIFNNIINFNNCGGCEENGKFK